MAYTETKTRYELIDADGESINYSVTANMIESGYCDRFPGSRVRIHVEEIELSPYMQVLAGSGIPREHWPLIKADMTRQRNMCRDAGRPSDAMRSAVSAFKAGLLTEESFAASRPSGHYPDDRA
jgi:hypothetical protein